MLLAWRGGDAAWGGPFSGGGEPACFLATNKMQISRHKLTAEAPNTRARAVGRGRGPAPIVRCRVRWLAWLVQVVVRKLPRCLEAGWGEHPGLATQATPANANSPSGPIVLQLIGQQLGPFSPFPRPTQQRATWHIHPPIAHTPLPGKLPLLLAAARESTLHAVARSSSKLAC